jgi:hypothetical protein
MARRTTLITTLLTMAAVAVIAITVPTAASAAITCETATSGGSTWYPGPSASNRYDDQFWPGPAVPLLISYTPQGMATWTNWDGSGHDVLLLGAYGSADSAITAIDPSTGSWVNTAFIKLTHASGLAIAGSWLLVSDSTKVERYPLASIRDRLLNGGARLSPSGTQTLAAPASFMTNYAGYIYAGDFQETSRGTMHKYPVDSSGVLSSSIASWQAPTKAQGVVIYPNRFIFSTSYGRTNRSNVYVVDSNSYSSSLDTAKLKCFRAPSLAEGMTSWGGRAYLAYEGGGPVYSQDPTTLNKIKNLHYAYLSTLAALV